MINPKPLVVLSAGSPLVEERAAHRNSVPPLSLAAVSTFTQIKQPRLAALAGLGIEVTALLFNPVADQILGTFKAL